MQPDRAINLTTASKQITQGEMRFHGVAIYFGEL